MRIATWNVERLRHIKALDEILRDIENVNAGILVLTETDRRLRPNYRFGFDTPMPAGSQPGLYASSENRVSVYTNYPCVRRHPTYDEATSLCVELETERGRLLVYGTIIGIYGNRHPSFSRDLARQMEDLERLSRLGRNVCFCGDFNCSFADNYYFTRAGREALLSGMGKCGLTILTGGQPECIDHIAVSKSFLAGAAPRVMEWNLDKRLSDHKGIAVTF